MALKPPAQYEYPTVLGDWLGENSGTITAVVRLEQPSDSPLDRVKSAILELPNDAQHEIYKFLYTLGHRMF